MGEHITLPIETPAAVSNDRDSCPGPCLSFQERDRAAADLRDHLPGEKRVRVCFPEACDRVGERIRINHLRNPLNPRRRFQAAAGLFRDRRGARKGAKGKGNRYL